MDGRDGNQIRELKKKRVLIQEEQYSKSRGMQNRKQKWAHVWKLPEVNKDGEVCTETMAESKEWKQ